MNSDIYTFEGVKTAASHEATAAIARVLGNEEYDASKVPKWVKIVGLSVVDSLEKMSGNFKYVVSVKIQPISDKDHVYEDVFSLTDNETDGSITARYENTSLVCVVSVQLISIFLDIVVGLRGLQFDYFHTMATLSYYGRALIWNVVLLVLIDAFHRVPQATVSALNSIILFALLLATLIYLKINNPKVYEDLRWFCTPSIIFLKSWTSMFFYAYLTQVPADLSAEDGASVISWIGQIFIGNVLVCLCCIGIFRAGRILKFLPEEDLEPQNETVTNKTKDVEETKKSEDTNDELSTYDNQEVILLATQHPRYKVDQMVNIAQYSDATRETLDSSSGRQKVFSTKNNLVKRSTSSISTETSLKNPIIQVTEADVEAAVVSPLTNEVVKPSLSLLVEKPREVHPFIPNIDQIFFLWLLIFFSTASINMLCTVRSHSATVCFQLSATVLIFMISSTYRGKYIGFFPRFLQTLLQSPIIFAPLAWLIVGLSGPGGFVNWQDNYNNYLVSASIYEINKWGAGNYASFLLDNAIVTLAFSSVDPLLTYSEIITKSVPLIFACCICSYLIAASFANLFQSTNVVALALLPHTVTTPIALSVAHIIGGPIGLTAATAIGNGVLGLKMDLSILNFMGVKDNVTRGMAQAITGTLLGVVALNENNETKAGGIGMAGYAIATILFAVIMAISPFESFITSFATGDL